MAFSYVFQRAYIVNNTFPTFRRLLPVLSTQATDLRLPQPGLEDRRRSLEMVIAYLNLLPGIEGFIYRHYSPGGTANTKYRRMYFSDANAKKIDHIRTTILRWWQEHLIEGDEYYVLLTSLLEAIPSVSNISGTYGAFLKSWDPRALKPLQLEVPEIIESDLRHEAYQEDANRLIGRIECDILYLDPPYNTRQYATNYHILETVARWDNPRIYGKTGLRPYKQQKSAYCIRTQAILALSDLVCRAKCKHILMSYNSEGIMPHEEIAQVLGKRGPLDLFSRPYRRFKSHSNHTQPTYPPNNTVVEKLYYVTVKD